MKYIINFTWNNAIMKQCQSERLWTYPGGYPIGLANLYIVYHLPGQPASDYFQNGNNSLAVIFIRIYRPLPGCGSRRRK